MGTPYQNVIDLAWEDDAHILISHHDNVQISRLHLDNRAMSAVPATGQLLPTR